MNTSISKICIPLKDNMGKTEISEDFTEASFYGIFTDSTEVFEKLVLKDLLRKYGTQNFIQEMYKDGITMIITQSLNLGAWLKFKENNIVVYKALTSNVNNEMERLKNQELKIFHECDISQKGGCSSCSSCHTDCKK